MKEVTNEYRWRVCFVDKKSCLGSNYDLMTAARDKICSTEDEAIKIAEANTHPKRAFYWQPSIYRERKVLVTTVSEQWVLENIKDINPTATEETK